MVKIGHFVAITMLFLSSVLAFGQIQKDVNGLEVRKPDDKNGILFSHEDVDDLERRSPFIQAVLAVVRGVKGIKSLVDHFKKKKHDKQAKAKAAKLAKAANHANDVQTHQKRMLEEDDELESEGKFSDDEPYRQDIDAFIEHYLDNKLRTFVVAILKNLAEEEVSKFANGKF